MIHHHTEFSNKLINLIPERFYLSDDTEKKWFQGLSKKQKANAKRETIENLKKVKRERLDPEISVLTTLDLQNQNLEKSGNETDIIKLMNVGLQEDYTFEKMRQRRYLKIEEIRRGDGNKKRKLNVIEETVKDLTYGYVKIRDDDEKEYGKKMKKKRFSKARELEMAMELEALKKDHEKGNKVRKKHLWHAAIRRAAGIKIRDDLKRLKQKIRKNKKKREKSAEKWKERVEVQKKFKVEKQQKRTENITDRIQQKKMRKIAKRERKLLCGY